MIRVIFPDGTPLKGEDATDVLARLGRLQWQPMDVAEMKAAMSDRAWAWSQTAVDPELDEWEFLLALDAAGLIAVERVPHKAKPKWPNSVPDWLIDDDDEDA